ncbi:Uncharacterized protein TCM_041185 isoform 1 [Theobroma cacao]|uniref:Uncharacterized protein isoform 1 n=1 Tax=Theobroma cacao TaxID=3641 RepID=A0A061GUT5_THECC|nr:Uncharacterized protein TCM_041185 isoform 1 [Theobroma cacao]
MGESSSESFLKKYWEGYRDFWAERFPFTEIYSRFIKREESLPPWSESDVHEFIASDPVHGPTLKTARNATNIALAGGAIGAISTAGLAWKYSRSLHGLTGSFLCCFGSTISTRRWSSLFPGLWNGRRSKGLAPYALPHPTTACNYLAIIILLCAGLSFAAGAVFGWTFGQEIANHWYQLYRLDTMAAQVKFLEWWESKCQRRS